MELLLRGKPKAAVAAVVADAQRATAGAAKPAPAPPPPPAPPPAEAAADPLLLAARAMRSLRAVLVAHAAALGAARGFAPLWAEVLALVERFSRLSPSPQLARAIAEELSAILVALLGVRVLAPPAEPPAAFDSRGVDGGAEAERALAAARVWEETRGAVGRICPQLSAMLAQPTDVLAPAGDADGSHRARQPTHSAGRAAAGGAGAATPAGAAAAAAATPAGPLPVDEEPSWVATFADEDAA